MNILITGVSSFTGLYFIRALHQRGHTIFGVHQSPIEQYTGIYKTRIELAKFHVQKMFQASFGDERFCDAIRNIDIDIYCHHGAYTKDYNSPNFPVEKAVSRNTYNVNTVCELLRRSGCQHLVSTSSIFAGNGPICSEVTPFSGYGIAKWRTDEIVKKASKVQGIGWSRYIIPNPFGPFDNHKLPYEMALQWAKNKPLVLKTPHYIRDNVPVQLLAEHYAEWVEGLTEKTAKTTAMPSGYVSTMQDFSERVANEIRLRTNWPCRIVTDQHSSIQPTVLHNTDNILGRSSFNEKIMWDELSAWFLEIAKD